MAGTAPRVINSLQRAFSILDLFDEQTAELGITEIAETLGLHKSTAAGLVYTLEHNGYLSQDPETRKYGLGFKLVERASTLLDQLDVRQVALPYLQELRAWCGESVNLAMQDGGQIVYIERLTSTQSLGMRAKVGYRAPMHCTALGKAILSALPREKVVEFIAQYGLPDTTVHSITDHAQFLQEIDRSRLQGFAVDNEENEIGVRCLAAPIFDHSDRAAAAVSISSPVFRFPLSEVPRYGQKVIEAANAISARLGYEPWKRQVSP
jgi:IclR family KDG regulon transcriptional repressor